MSEHKQKYTELADQTYRLASQQSENCTRCESCTSSCPSIGGMDILPRYIMQLVKAGRLNEIFESKTLSGCLNCLSCNLVCSQGGDVKSIMTRLREMARLRTESRPREPEAAELKELPPYKLLT